MGPSSFDKADEIIKIGYDAAAAKSKVLMTLAVDDATWKQYLADREARRRTNPVPTFVAVEGVQWSIFRSGSKSKWPAWWASPSTSTNWTRKSCT